MSTIKIERNIKLPPPRGLYPFSDMKEGDSFFLPFDKAKPNLSMNVSAAAHAHKKKTGISFTCRKQTDRGVVGVRVWRVS